MDQQEIVDVAIVGGGPAGLNAALMLGRSRKRVVLFDAGPPRNAAAEHVHGFLTRDGTPPAEMRRIAREQLVPYRSVTVRDARVEAIDVPAAGADRAAQVFTVRAADGVVKARRILLTVGLVDDLPDLPGVRELWGKSLFICPYCHAWELQDQPFGYLAPSAQWLEWTAFLKNWTRDLTVYTAGAFEIPEEAREKLTRAGIRIEERPITGLRADGGKLAAITLADGAEAPCAALFMRPSQRQTPLVASLGLALDEMGFVKVDEMKQTSVRGIFAAGDLTTMMQGALLAAAAGVTAAATVNHALTSEQVEAGEL